MPDGEICGCLLNRSPNFPLLKHIRIRNGNDGIRSIAFPSISTGVYSFPVELAAKIAVHTVNRVLQDNPDCFDLVEWVLFDTHTESVYEAEADKLYEENRLCQKN